MSKPTDDLEAVRLIADTLQPFPEPDRDRIIRWARERLGMPHAATTPPVHGTLPASTAPAAGQPRDIRSFIQQKNPRNERHLAAVVAYFFQLEAPEAQRKDAISSQDLTDASRAANWSRPKHPAQTLINAFNSGYLDKTSERGRYRLNAVGENLVAMVLPEGEAAATAPRSKNRGRNSKKPKPKNKKPKKTKASPRG
jgi:hypothetical protein